MDWYRRQVLAHAAVRTEYAGLARQTFAMLRTTARRAETQLLAVTLPGRAVFVLALALGGWALGVYYTTDITMVQGDAVGHLFIARRMFDSITPSITGLGGIWLPLPHLLMLPMIWSDTMWRTGLAGSIVSTVVFAASAVYIHRLVTAVSASGLAGLLAAAIFATNPNMLFMQSTPMTEPITIFVLLGSAYHLVRWAQDDSSLHLFLSALFVFLATLTRYEAWILVPVGVSIVALATWRRHRSVQRVEAYTLIWGVIAAYGIVIWLIYEQVIFGDALNFSHGEFTGAALAAELERAGALPYKGHPLLASATYGWSVVDALGLPLVIAGVAGFAALCMSRLPLYVKLAATLPVWLFVFNVASLTQGGSAMASPHASPPEFENTRYGLLMLPAAVIAAGALVRPLRSLGIVLLVAALVPQLLVLSGPTSVASVARQDANLDQAALTSRWKSANFPFLSGDRPIVVTDATHHGGFLFRHNGAGDWLREHADSGRILISTARNDGPALMMRAHIDAARFVHEGNKPYFGEEQAAFGTHADWIVFEALEPGDTLRPLMARAYPSGFQIVFDDGHYQVFERDKPSTYLSRPPGVARSASLVQEDRLLGSIADDPNIPASHRYVVTSADCPYGLLSLRTTRGTIYAETPCSGWFTPELAQRISHTPARFGLQVEPTVQLTIETGSGAPVRLPARRLWVEMTDKPVPAGAKQITVETTIGSLDADADPIEVRRTYSARCANETLTITTDRERIYAEFPCAQVPVGLPGAGVAGPVSIAVEPRVGEDSVMRIAAKPAATMYELRTGRVWQIPIAPAHVSNMAVTLDEGVVIGEDGTERLLVAECRAGGIGLETTAHVLFIETPCRHLEQVAPLEGVAVQLYATGGESPAFVIETNEAGSLELPASRVWVRAFRPGQ